MQPTGAEIEQLQRALLQAYNFDDFRTMLRIGMDVDLEQIVPLIDRNFTQIVYSTVRWAAAQEGGFLRLANLLGDGAALPVNAVIHMPYGELQRELVADAVHQIEKCDRIGTT